MEMVKLSTRRLEKRFYERGIKGKAFREYCEVCDMPEAVKETYNLDHFDRNSQKWVTGSTGEHLGLGKMGNGLWYLCRGTQSGASRSWAECIEEPEAKRLCLEHNPNKYEKLFGEPVPVKRKRERKNA